MSSSSRSVSEAGLARTSRLPQPGQPAERYRASASAVTVSSLSFLPKPPSQSLSAAAASRGASPAAASFRALRTAAVTAAALPSPPTGAAAASAFSSSAFRGSAAFAPSLGAAFASLSTARHIDFSPSPSPEPDEAEDGLQPAPAPAAPLSSSFGDRPSLLSQATGATTPPPAAHSLRALRRAAAPPFPAAPAGDSSGSGASLSVEPQPLPPSAAVRPVSTTELREARGNVEEHRAAVAASAFSSSASAAAAAKSSASSAGGRVPLPHSAPGLTAAAQSGLSAPPLVSRHAFAQQLQQQQHQARLPPSLPLQEQQQQTELQASPVPQLDCAPASPDSSAVAAASAAAERAEAELEQQSAQQRARHKSALQQLAEEHGQEPAAWERQHGAKLAALRQLIDGHCGDGASEKLEAKMAEKLRSAYIAASMTGEADSGNAQAADLRLELKQQAAEHRLQEMSAAREQLRQSRQPATTAAAVQRSQMLQRRQAWEKAEQRRQLAARERAGAERQRRLIERTMVRLYPSFGQQMCDEVQAMAARHQQPEQMEDEKDEVNMSDE